MKVVNERLELVDYEESEKEEKDEYTSTTASMFGYKMMAEVALIDLIYDMRKNMCHKMSLIIVMTQIIIFLISITLQFIFQDYKEIISLSGALGSIILMCLVVINTKVADIATKQAYKQREVIEHCINNLSKRS